VVVVVVRVKKMKRKSNIVIYYGRFRRLHYLAKKKEEAVIVVQVSAGHIFQFPHRYDVTLLRMCVQDTLVPLAWLQRRAATKNTCKSKRHHQEKTDKKYEN
jgi:hypothetical protein